MVNRYFLGRLEKIQALLSEKRHTGMLAGCFLRFRQLVADVCIDQWPK